MKMRWGDRAFALVAALTAVRLVVISATDLSDTEAYYVGWARWPSLSYYDHPPLVAWTTWLVSTVASSAFAFRLLHVVCAGVFGLLVYSLGARLFSARAGFIALAIVSMLPAFLMTSVLVNPEALLAPLWALMLITIYDLREHDEAWRPLVVGAVIGVAFLAKYTAILGVPLALGWVASSKETRRWLRRPSFYLAGVVALAFAAPVIMWNASRGFPSVKLHFVERTAEPSFATYASGAWHTLVSQLALFNPFVWPALVVAAGIVVSRARRDERFRFLAWMGAPTLAFFFVMMVRVRDAEPHWTMVAYVPLAMGMAALLDEVFDRRAARVYIASAAALSTLGLGLYFVHMASPVLLRFIPVSMYDARADPVNETLGWARIDAAIRAQAAALGPRAVVASNHNVLCGHLEVALDDSPNVYCTSNGLTEFDFVGRGVVARDIPVVYVDSERYARDPSLALAGRVCALGERVNVMRADTVVQRVRVWSCIAERPPEGEVQALR
jgi:4-amino-4-deoxy-L-arabinose transferase-like glycosyltransferase